MAVLPYPRQPMKNKLVLLGLCAFACSALPVSAATTRVWTDSLGRKVEATFVKLEGDNITITLADDGSDDARTSLRLEVPCSWSSAILARLDCRLLVTYEACIWLVMRTDLPLRRSGHRPTRPVRLMSWSSISSTAVRTRAAPW